MLTVYGIKSCDTCRKARKYFAENDIEFRFHDVRDDGLDIQMLERWSARLEWQKLLNRQSLTWRVRYSNHQNSWRSGFPKNASATSGKKRTPSRYGL